MDEGNWDRLFCLTVGIWLVSMPLWLAVGGAVDRLYARNVQLTDALGVAFLVWMLGGGLMMVGITMLIGWAIEHKARCWSDHVSERNYRR